MLQWIYQTEEFLASQCSEGFDHVTLSKKEKKNEKQEVSTKRVFT